MRSFIPRSTAIASANESTLRSPGARVSAVDLPDRESRISLQNESEILFWMEFCVPVLFPLLFEAAVPGTPADFPPLPDLFWVDVAIFLAAAKDVA